MDQELPCQEELRVLVDKKMDIKQQCALAAQKFKHILVCTKSRVASRPRVVILLLYSTLMRPLDT